VPADHDARVRWLYEWWERIDTWIEQHRPEAVPAGPTIAPDPLPG